jgi:hypothetical protein
VAVDRLLPALEAPPVRPAEDLENADADADALGAADTRVGAREEDPDADRVPVTWDAPPASVSLSLPWVSLSSAVWLERPRWAMARWGRRLPLVPSSRS